MASLPFCHFSLKTSKPKCLGYPTELKTIGDYLRKRRLDLGLLQKEVGQRIVGCVASLRHWELGKGFPQFKHLPAIIDVLGYKPNPGSGRFRGSSPVAPNCQGLELRDLRPAYWRRSIESEHLGARGTSADVEMSPEDCPGVWQRGSRLPVACLGYVRYKSVRVGRTSLAEFVSRRLRRAIPPPARLDSVTLSEPTRGANLLGPGNRARSWPASSIHTAWAAR